MIPPVYQEELDKLQAIVPERALYCYPEECAQKPMCYTNYEPHYNPKQLLSAILLPVSNMTSSDSPGWISVRKNGQGASDDPKYGHMDKRTVYVVRGSGH